MPQNAEPRAPNALFVTALIALVFLPSGALLTNIGLIEFRLGLLLTAAAFLLGALVVVASLILILFPNYATQRLKLLLSTVCAAIPTMVAVSVFSASAGLPMIHDISTDITDPPQFQAATALRGEQSNPVERNREIDEMQLAAYPNIKPLITTAPSDKAFSRALQVAKDLGWDVHSTAEQSGLIEATFTSQWFGFVDDIVIRVRPHESGGTQIDLRSVSRVGKGDLGANAKRIAAFTEAFNAD